MQLDCSVIILNYNTKEFLERMLRSIETFTKDISYDVWVVDNASPDGSAEMVRQKFPKVNLIASPENVYVARGFNLGIKASKGRYMFIGDADLEFTDNLLARMVKFLDENPGVAGVGPPFYYPDGRFFSQCYSRDQHWLYSLFNYSLLGKVFPKTMKELLDDFMYADWDRKSSREVENLDTAILLRRSVVDQIGPYDPNFDLYAIQYDLCYRIRQAGWKNYYLYEGHLIHAQHQSIQKENWGKISAIYRKDIAYFLSKRYGKLQSLIVMMALQLTRAVLFSAIFLGLYKPKKNMAFGTLG